MWSTIEALQNSNNVHFFLKADKSTKSRDSVFAILQKTKFGIANITDMITIFFGEFALSLSLSNQDLSANKLFPTAVFSLTDTENSLLHPKCSYSFKIVEHFT